MNGYLNKCIIETNDYNVGPEQGLYKRKIDPPNLDWGIKEGF